jgi:hypothetical protein
MRNDTRMLSIMIADKTHPSRSPVVAMIVPASALISGLEEVSRRCAGTEWTISKIGPNDIPPHELVPDRSGRPAHLAAPGWGRQASEWR